MEFNKVLVRICIKNLIGSKKIF